MTGRLTVLGHEVCVGNYRGPETLAGLAKEGWRSRLPGHRDSRIREIELGLPGKPVNGKAIGQIRGNARQLKAKGHTAKRFRLHCAVDEDGDAKAKVVVMRLVEELGFDQVNAGGLDHSWPQLPGTPVPAADFNSGKRVQHCG